jgi:hypothetical protein
VAPSAFCPKAAAVPPQSTNTTTNTTAPYVPPTPLEYTVWPQSLAPSTLPCLPPLTRESSSFRYLLLSCHSLCSESCCARAAIAAPAGPLRQSGKATTKTKTRRRMRRGGGCRQVLSSVKSL